MTGPEHYAQAERLIETVGKEIDVKNYGPLTYFDADDETRVMIEAAQVHATLALAAATAYPAIVAHTGDEAGFEARSWAEVTEPIEVTP